MVGSVRARRGISPALVVVVVATLVWGAVGGSRLAQADEDFLSPDPAAWCYKQPDGLIDVLVNARYWDSPQFATTNGKLYCRFKLLVEDESVGSHIVPWTIEVNWPAVCTDQFPGSRYVFSPGYPNNAACAKTAPRTYRNRIVQWNADAKPQKSSWFVSGMLKRYWIPDGGTYNCLKGQGFGGPDLLASDMLNQLPDQSGQGVACGGDTLGVNRAMFRGTYLRSADGRYSLNLQSDGNLVMYGPSGVVWANYQTSDMAILQGDGNLVTYTFGGVATWSSGTSGTGANRLAVQSDGNLVLYSPSTAIWTYRGRIQPPAANYRNRIVQWSGDTKPQKTAWFVAGTLKRYWIPDGGTYNCLKAQGFGGPDVLPSAVLDQLTDQSGQSVGCGADTLTVNKALFRGTYLRSADGRYSLILQGDGNLVMYGPSGVVWANYRTSDMLILQGDGNLVTYTFGGGATWSSGTSGTGANRLIVQGDGNLVLYAPSRAVWTYRGRI